MNSNLPPGCTSADIERAFGGGDVTELEDEVLEVLERHAVPTAVCDNIMNLLAVWIAGLEKDARPEPDPLDEKDNLGESPDY